MPVGTRPFRCEEHRLLDVADPPGSTRTAYRVPRPGAGEIEAGFRMQVATDRAARGARSAALIRSCGGIPDSGGR